MTVQVKPGILFITYVTVVALPSCTVLRDLARLSFSEPTASHILAIPFISVFLVFWRRAEIFAHTGSGGALALAAVALGLCLFVGGRLAGSLTASAGAVVILWIAGFLLFFGRHAARSASFALLFLVFIVPPPELVVSGINTFLKAESSEAVAALFTLTTTSYYREGAVFSLPGFTIEVTDECSGIRSSVALLLTALVAGHVLLNSFSKRVLLVAVVVPLAVLKNATRIVSLSLLTLHTKTDFLAGRLHHEGGFVFFAITLGLLAPFVLFLRRWDLAQVTRRTA